MIQCDLSLDHTKIAHEKMSDFRKNIRETITSLGARMTSFFTEPGDCKSTVTIESSDRNGLNDIRIILALDGKEEINKACLVRTEKKFYYNNNQERMVI